MLPPLLLLRANSAKSDDSLTLLEPLSAILVLLVTTLKILDNNPVNPVQQVPIPSYLQPEHASPVNPASSPTHQPPLAATRAKLDINNQDSTRRLAILAKSARPLQVLDKRAARHAPKAPTASAPAIPSARSVTPDGSTIKMK